jgi:large subunit ribosomal protein L9
MKLILRDDVKDLGRAGDTVNVAEGYGRNFLLPKKLAVLATPASLKRLEQELNGKKGRERRTRRDAEYLAERLASKPLVIIAQVGEGGKLFGSVTAADIEQALAAQGLEIDKRKIELEEPIRMVGSYHVAVKLPSEVTAQLTVSVEAKAEPKTAKAEAAPVSAPGPEASPEA